MRTELVSSCYNLLLKIYVIGFKNMGESILILFLDTKESNKVVFSLLIDCYKAYGLNVVEEILNEYNLGRDNQPINVICWSHPHMDHSKGLYDVIWKYSSPKTKIIIPFGIDGAFYQLKDLTKTEKQNLKKINELIPRYNYRLAHHSADIKYKRELEMFKVEGHDGTNVKVRIYSIAPHDEFLYKKIQKKEFLDTNDFSLVTYMEVGAYKFLLTGDVKNDTIDNLDDECMDGLNFIKIPHHTSMTSNHMLKYMDISNKTLGCTTSYKRNGILPDLELLDMYKEKCAQINCTGMSKGKYKYGYVEYTFDLWNNSEVRIENYGNAFVV